MLRKLGFTLLLLVLAGLLPAATRADAALLDMEAGLPLAYPGPIGVFNLYWKTSWDQTQMSTVDNNTRAVFTSDYAVKAAQYGVPGFSWAGSRLALGLCPQAKSLVQIQDIAAFVICEESLGGVPAEGGAVGNFGSATMIYNVIVPAGTTVQLPDGSQSCTPGGFGGFHYFTPSGPRLFPLAPPGRPILFTVIPAACAGGFLPIISHEVVEAATDPVPLPPTYWIDDSSSPNIGGRFNPANWSSLLKKGEAGDICSALYVGEGSLRERAQAAFSHAPYVGTDVGAFWSNADHACVVGTSRLVWAEFRSSGPNGPTSVTVDGTSYSLPHDQLLFHDATYQFTNPPPGAGRRYRFFGDCSGTVTFPGTVDAAAARSLACGAVLQDEVSFTASGLSGQAWQVWFNGIPHDGPTSTWVDDGTSFPFLYADVAGCTFTGASSPSPLIVTAPVTVTGNYNCPPPPPPPPVTYADVIRGDGPVAYWRLGDNGPTAKDSGPYGLDGSYEPGVTEGVAGAVVNDPDTADEFAGGGVAMPSYFGLDILGPLSVEVWAKGGPQQPYAYLVSKSDWSGTFGYSLYAGVNGTLRFFVGTGSSQITDEVGFAWDGQWHHIVGVYDGSTVRLYVDKALIASTPASGTIASSFGTPLTLGRFNGGGFTFAGDLDEVAIYDHALTTDQIHHHYNQAIFGSIYG